MEDRSLCPPTNSTALLSLVTAGALSAGFYHRNRKAIVENEIKTAADWWTKQLSGTKQDAKLGGNGDMLLAVAAIIGAISWAMSESSLFGFHL